MRKPPDGAPDRSRRNGNRTPTDGGARETPFCIRPLAGLLIAALWAAFSWPASAQAIELFCGDHTQITNRLGKSYAESRIGFGRLDDSRLVEIFASPQGTWSLLVTWPNGPTCLVASGAGWQDLPRAAPPQIEESAI